MGEEWKKVFKQMDFLETIFLSLRDPVYEEYMHALAIKYRHTLEML
jgi:hypothetical protein